MTIVLIVLAALALGVLLRRWSSNPSTIQAGSDTEAADSVFLDTSFGSDTPSDQSHLHHWGGVDWGHHDACAHSFDSGHGGGFDCGFDAGGHHH